MILSSLSFLAGLLVIQQLPELPETLGLLVATVVLGIMARLHYWRGFFFVLGLLWAIVFATLQLAERLPVSLEGKDFALEGTVSSLPEANEKRTRFDFRVTKSSIKLPSKLRLSWYSPPQAIKAGQHWAVTVRLKRPHGSFNPNSFDYEQWLFTQGIGATGNVRSAPLPVLLKTDAVYLNMAALRQLISDKLSLLLADSNNLALIKALTIGEGNDITQEQWAVFRNTGTIHLIVISGSHIGLVAGLIYFLSLKFWVLTGVLRYSPQQIAACCSLASGAFYSALAGFSIPVIRSLVMLSVVMFALLSQHHTRPFHTLTLALVAVSIIDPVAVLSPGFWLSFSAVALMVFASFGRLQQETYFFEAVKINWVTSVGLSPLLLLFFSQVPVISPIANFIAIPVISLIVVPCALLASMLMFITPLLATQIFTIVDWTLQGLYELLVQLATLPFATLQHTPASLWELIFAVPALLILLSPMGFPARSLGLVMLLPLMFTAPKKILPGEIKLTLLDVGQGLALVVETQSHCLVFDTGAKFSKDSDMGQSVLVPFLQGQGVREIDTLIISHGDNDHIGGAESLLKALPVAKLLTSSPKQLTQFTPLPCRSGQSWLWDEVKFTVLSPAKHFESDNDNSCVLHIQSAQGSVLLTGDIEATAESWLVAHEGEHLKAKMLIAPHHGSKTSSSAVFLTTVQAETVLISAGYRNAFGHPHQEVLTRYQNLNMHWLNTKDQGAITVRVENNTWQIESLRATRGKYWNDKVP